MTRTILPLIAAATLAFPAVATADKATSTTNAQVTQSNQSNWPDHPERQGGASYSKVIQSGFGHRERNFESGRR